MPIVLHRLTLAKDALPSIPGSPLVFMPAHAGWNYAQLPCTWVQRVSPDLMR